jgi:hypothetical protein
MLKPPTFPRVTNVPLSRIRAIFRVAIVVLAGGLLIQVNDAPGASWASGDQATECLTVPTRTPTPEPATPTEPPPPATATPAPPAPATHTATASPTLTVTPLSTAPGDATPLTLPAAGGGSWSLEGGALLLVSGTVMLLVGRRARRRKAL